MPSEKLSYLNAAKALAQGLAVQYIGPGSRTFDGIVSGFTASLLDENPRLDTGAFHDSVVAHHGAFTGALIGDAVTEPAEGKLTEEELDMLFKTFEAIAAHCIDQGLGRDTSHAYNRACKMQLLCHRVFVDGEDDLLGGL